MKSESVIDQIARETSLDKNQAFNVIAAALQGLAGTTGPRGPAPGVTVAIVVPPPSPPMDPKHTPRLKTHLPHPGHDPSHVLSYIAEAAEVSEPDARIALSILLQNLIQAARAAGIEVRA